MSLLALGGAQLTACSSNPSDDRIVPLFVCPNHVSLALVQDAMGLSSWDVDTKHAFVTDYCLCQFPCATNLSVTLRSGWWRPRLGALPLSQACTVLETRKLDVLCTSLYTVCHWHQFQHQLGPPTQLVSPSLPPLSVGLAEV